MAKETIDLLVESGNAKPSPTTVPKFSQYKINMGEIFQKINEETKEYKGMNVPVKVVIDTDTKAYTIKVGVPPVSSLIKKELKLEKIGSGPKKEKAIEEAAPVVKAETPAKKPKKAAPVVEAKPEEEEEKSKIRVMVGNLTIDQCIKIAKMKQSGLLSKTLKNAVKEVVGSCVSMPITVEGKSPKDVLKDIDSGIYDSKLQ